MPITPTERSCVVDPITPDELAAAAAGPVPRRAEPVESAEPVTDEELQQITRVVRIMTACTNANRPMAALALVTPMYIAEYFAGPAGQDQLGHLIAVSTREPDPTVPEDRLTLVAIEHPVRYDDGRIAVMVTTANADERYLDQLIFTETAGGWRLDQAIAGETVGAEATPTQALGLASRSFHRPATHYPRPFTLL
jgi:hypothetical protein